jgi:hypothetical protein
MAAIGVVVPVLAVTGALTTPSLRTGVEHRPSRTSIGRRQLLAFTAAAISTPVWAVDLPEYDEEGKLVNNKGYSEETQFRTIKQGAASIQMLAAWRARDDGSYDDPTTGSAMAGFAMKATPTLLADTAALGRPENLDVVKAFELDPDFKRADLVAAAVRKTSQGITFYDFDLALPAKQCDAQMATVCLPERVVLLSCGICDGQLHTVRADATASQWKNAGRALRLLRSSFSVTKA